MLRKQILRSLSLYLVFGAICADDNEACPDVKPVENFHMVNYSHNWYLFAVGRQNIDEKDLRCIRSVFYQPFDNLDDLPVVYLYVNPEDNTKKMILQFAKFNSKGQGTSLRGYSFTVAATNYDKWSVVIGCDESSNTRLAWIFTREPNPPIFSLFPAYGVLREHNLSLAEFRTVDQNNCPNDWSDAEKDEVDFIYDDVKLYLEILGIAKEDEDSNEDENEADENKHDENEIDENEADET